MRKKIGLIMVFLILVALVTHPKYLLFISRGSAPLTISELKARSESIYGQQLKVEGTVAAGSINYSDETQVIKFTLTDNKETMKVLYQGTVPNNFKPGAELILEGNYRPNGVFEAVDLNSSRSLCAACHQ